MDSYGKVFNLPSFQALLAGITIGLLTYYIYTKLKYKFPPGPWAIPLVGNWKIYSSVYMHREVAKLSKKYGPVMSISIGPMKVVFLNNLESIMEALVTKKADFASRNLLKSMNTFTDNGKGIAFAPYSARWKYQKKVAGKALRYYMQGTHLEDMVNDVCGVVFEEMGKETGPFTPRDYIHRMVTHMIYNMCYGTKCIYGNADVEYIYKANTDLNASFGAGFLEDIIPFMSNIYTTQRLRKALALADDFFAFLTKLVKQHEETFDSNNIRDFLDSILLARQEAEADDNHEQTEMLSTAHVIHIMSDMIFGGIDTTRMTLDWFVCFMTANQDLQAKCQDEIDKIIGLQRTPRVGDRPSLPFTEACIMETMRMGAVVGLGLPHATICDTTVCGYDIPKGTTVFINHFALHNDANFWKDVDKFDPYRYLDKDGNIDAKPENWLPFGAGRRVCLAEPISRTELILIAANLLQTFTFKSPPGVKLEPEGVSDFTGTEIPKAYKVVLERRRQ